MTITVIVELVVHQQAQDQDDKTSIILTERWETRKAYEDYNLWRREKGDLDRLATLLSALPKRRFFDHLAV